MTTTDSSNHHHDTDRADLPPWQRPAEPDHPMMVEGDVIDGDTQLMFRCMVEEYLLAGHSPRAILDMCRRPDYQAFHAAMHSLGCPRGESIIADAAARVGHHRVRFSESSTTATSVALTMSASAGSSKD